MIRDNAHLAPRPGRHLVSIRRVTILLALAVLAITLAGSSRVRAADCTTPDACYSAAAWQKALAQDYYNKSVFFREMARQQFVSAKQWYDKATFAFHAGDGTAAAWYKAIADDYAHKAAASSKAADDNYNAYRWVAAAANSSIQRALAITAFFLRGPSPAEQNSDQNGAGSTGGDGAVYTTASAGEHCINPRNREWSGGGIHVYLVAKEFCWKNHEVTGLHVPYNADITGVADAQLSEDGCWDERWWYAWDLNYDHSGRKVLITCRFKAKPAGIIPITVGTLTCRVALYFHGNGSYAYTKPDKMRCDKDITLP